MIFSRWKIHTVKIVIKESDLVVYSYPECIFSVINTYDYFFDFYFISKLYVIYSEKDLGFNVIVIVIRPVNTFQNNWIIFIRRNTKSTFVKILYMNDHEMSRQLNIIVVFQICIFK